MCQVIDTYTLGEPTTSAAVESIAASNFARTQTLRRDLVAATANHCVSL